MNTEPGRALEILLVLIAGVSLLNGALSGWEYRWLASRIDLNEERYSRVREGATRRLNSQLPFKNRIALLTAWAVAGCWIVFIAPAPPKYFVCPQTVVAVGLLYLDNIGKWLAGRHKL